MSLSFFLPAADPRHGVSSTSTDLAPWSYPTSTCGKKNYASAQTKQEREQKEMKTKPLLLYVQCREIKKKEISNKELGKSAGGKNLQTITGNLSSARRDLQQQLLYCLFYSWKEWKSLPRMWQKIHCNDLKLREVWYFPVSDRLKAWQKRAFIFLVRFPLQSDFIAPG